MIIEKLIEQVNLSETEKQIALYILDKENNIDALTSVELGRRSYTSQSAVTRLYKKLGLKTYREFISKIIVERNEYFKAIEFDVEQMRGTVSSYEGIQKMISQLYAQTMRDTNRLLDKNVIIRLCNRLLSSKMLDIYAVGCNESLAAHFSYKLQLLGITCSLHNSYNPQYIQYNQNQSKRVSLIIVSNHVNDTIISIAKLLKEKNMYTVALCPKSEKELMFLAYEYIHFSVMCNEDYENICTCFAVEYVLDVICSILLSRNIK